MIGTKVTATAAFQHFNFFEYPQKLDNTNCAIVTIVAFVTINANGAIVIIVVPPLSLMDHHDGN